MLASASAYFRAMFAGGFRENCITSSPTGHHHHEILVDPLITYPVLKSLIDFIYTNSIEIKEDNVQDLLMASKALQIDDVVNACCVFLYLNIDPSNCIGVEKLAKQLGCVSLARKAQKVTVETGFRIVYRYN